MGRTRYTNDPDLFCTSVWNNGDRLQNEIYPSKTVSSNALLLAKHQLNKPAVGARDIDTTGITLDDKDYGKIARLGARNVTSVLQT